MNFIKKLTVGGKLVSGFSIMILLMASVGVMGYLSIGAMKENLDEIFTLRLPSLDYLVEADRDLQQLLVAERSMIFADVKSDNFKDLTAAYEENLRQADERWDKYKALAGSEEEKAVVPKYEEAREAWKSVSRKVFDGRMEDTRQGRRLALDLSLGEANRLFEEMRDYLDQLTGINLKNAADAHLEADKLYRTISSVLLIFVGFGVLAGCALSWGISRGVTRPLRLVINRLGAASDQVSSGSAQLASSSQGLAQGASEQAASLEETSSSLEEMSSMTRNNAENAAQAEEIMKEAARIVERVSQHMGDMAEAIGEIDRSSEETGKIIKTIDEIAFQTNLLALNAAVEAARAGEAGAGFAVVADEVRNLAMRAAEAARNTTELIEKTVKAVRNGKDLTQLTREAFGENIEISSKLGDLFSEIAGASGEQAKGIELVSKAVAEMDSVVQRVSANAEESASASEEMNAQAGQMMAVVRELNSLVGGKVSSDGGKRHGSLKAADPARRGAEAAGPEAPAKKRHALSPTHEVAPEQVIPFGDDDFEDC